MEERIKQKKRGRKKKTEVAVTIRSEINLEERNKTWKRSKRTKMMN